MLIRNISIKQIRSISQAALDRLTPITQQQLNWKAGENDPRKHNESHLGLFYELPNDETLVKMTGSSSPFGPGITLFYNTINRWPLMVRKPALSIIEAIKEKHLSNESLLPHTRYLLYGDPGDGKTHTLIHLLHYLYLSNSHLIINIRNMIRFTLSPRDYAQSNTRAGRIDTPLHSALFLQQFRLQNSFLLEKLRENLTCSQDYKWSNREMTKAGEPIENIAEHGINRVIHSSDCMAVLIKELMLASDQDHKKALVDDLTAARALKKLIKGNYKNGLTLATCHDVNTKKQNQTPEDVLREDGLDYFVDAHRVLVPRYSRKEFENCMNFYQDIGWLARPETKTQEIRDELRFVSGLKPSELNYLCQSI